MIDHALKHLAGSGVGVAVSPAGRGRRRTSFFFDQAVRKKLSPERARRGDIFFFDRPVKKKSVLRTYFVMCW